MGERFEGSSQRQAVLTETSNWRWLRYVVYGAITAALAEILVVAATSGSLRVVGSEQGPVEYAHLLLCAATCLLFACAAHSRPQLCDVFVLAAYAGALGSIREADALLDSLVFKGAYKVPAAILGAFVLARAYTSRHGLTRQIREFAREPGFVLAAVGAFMVLIYAQIIGQKDLWQVIMGDAYARPVKDAAEELQELLGYLLIFFGSLDAFITARHRAGDLSVREPSRTQG